MDHRTPAQLVIEAFGGIRPLARAVGRTPSAVMDWKRSGLIPSRMQRRILEVAQARSLTLTADDLVHGRQLA